MAYGPYSTAEEPDVIFDPFPGPIVGLLADADWNTFGGQAGEIMLLEGNPLNLTVVRDTYPVFLYEAIPENTIYKFSRISTTVDELSRIENQPFLYPNPSFGEVNLNHLHANEVIFPIILIDVLGNQVMKWNSMPDISTSGLTAGCYFAMINTKSKFKSEKLILISD